MQNRPFDSPKLATRLLTWLLRDDLAEEVLGDLEEQFGATARSKTVFRAKLNYWYQVVNYLRPFALRKSKPNCLYQMDIYRNYFKTGYRNLLRNKAYSFINIGGLAVGMAVAILISLWIFDEWSFNHYHENYKRVARVMQHQSLNGRVLTGSAVPFPLDNEMREVYGSDFKYIAMATWEGDHILSHADKRSIFSGNYMDADIPEMLSLRMIYGSRDGLREQGSVLLSQSVAETFFGAENPVGQPMKIDNSQSVIVTGVYEDLPFNTDFHSLKFIAPWELFVATEEWVQKTRDEQRWSDNSFQMYVQIQDFANMQEVSDKIARVKYNKVSENEKQYQPRISLHSMEDWHLRGQYKNGLQTGGLIQYVWMFGAVGVFVLVLACINFMNLSTARSEKRAKEVGIRKSLGSVRRQLINQFLSESFLVVIIAFVLSLVLVILVMPAFNQLANKQIAFPFTNWSFWLTCLGFIVITGFIAGSYPAFYLSSFHPVKVLKGTFKAGKSASTFRRSLVVLQFSVSVTLITGTLIVRQQIRHSMNRPLGYDLDGILMVQMNSPEYAGKYEVLRDELKKSGAVLEMAESSGPLTGIWSNSGGIRWEGKDPSLQVDFAVVRVTHDFGNTVNWQLAEGRDFSRDFATDTAAFIINETAARIIGFENPVGKTVRWGSEEHGRDFKIIGVVKDMLMDSPFRPVKQCIYVINYDGVAWIEMKLNPEKTVHEAIEVVEEVFAYLLPEVPFDYQFADQAHARKFASEQRIESLSGIFALLAVFISCLGLFGLVSFVAEQRSKEIGIRKVLGATVLNIWSLISGEFLLLVVISCGIATPLAYYFLSSWLSNYEYHITIGWWIFLLAGGSALLITLFTVSFQALKAAVANPVKSLRTE